MTEEMRAAGLHTMRPLFDMVEVLPRDEPFFLYVHTVEPHWPFEGQPREVDPFHDLTLAERDRINELVMSHRTLLQRRSAGQLEPGDLERLEEVEAELLPRLADVSALYDGDVRKADDVIARLWRALDYYGHAERTILVVLSDHGEELLDHGLWFHDQSLYHDLVHVPLVVRVPGLTDGGRRIATPVQVIDVLPTLAALVGAEPLPFWQGRSLLPLLLGAEPDAPPAVLSMRENVDRLLGGDRGDRETAILKDGYKLILHHDVRRSSLYDLGEDPGEQTDLSGEQPQREGELRSELFDLLRRMKELPIRAVEEMDDGKLQHLKELGYVESDEEG